MDDPSPLSLSHNAFSARSNQLNPETLVWQIEMIVKRGYLPQIRKTLIEKRPELRILLHSEVFFV